MADYTPNAGDIEINLDGKKKWLRPSLDACLKISRLGDKGPRAVADQCLQLNLDAITAVVAAGLGVAASDIQAEVYKTGTINLYGACLRFIHVVANGGRPPQSDEDQNTAEDPQKSG